MVARFDVRADRSGGATVVYQNSGGRYLAHEAITRAIGIDESGVVRIVGDMFRLDQPVYASKGNLRIELSPRTHIIIGNAAAVGGFHFSGPNMSLAGGTILVETWVNDQTIVRFAGCDGCSVVGTKIDVTAAGGSSVNPMTLYHFQDCVDPQVSFTKTHPAAGVRCFYFQNGSRGFWSNNYIGHSGDGGNGSVGPTYASRLCWEALEILGWEFWEAADNIMRGLGAPEAQLGIPILIANSNDNTQEQGHWKFSGLKMEDVDAKNMMVLRGQWFCEIDNCDFGASPGPQTNNTVNVLDCALLIDGAVGGSIDSREITVSNCKFHNIQHSSGQIAVVTASTAVEIVSGNTFQLTSGSWLSTPVPTQVIEVTIGGVIRYHTVVSATASTIVVASALTNAAAGTATTITAAPVAPAPALFIQNSRRIDILNNRFTLGDSGPSIIVRGDNTSVLNVIGNTFDGVAPPPTRPIRFVRLGATDTLGLVQWRNNSIEGYFEGNEPPIGFTGPIMWNGQGFDPDRTIVSNQIAVQSIATSPGDRPRLSATALAATATTISFVNAGDAASGRAEINRSSGSFAFANGDWVRVTGTANNDGLYRIQTAGTTSLQLYAGFNLVTEAAGSSFTIARAMFAGALPGDLFELDGPAIVANRGLMRVRSVTPDGNGLDLDTDPVYFPDFTSETAGSVSLMLRWHPRSTNNVAEPIQF